MSGEDATPVLQHLKLSEIRFAAAEELLLQPPDGGGAWAARVRPTGYAAAFQAALDGAPGADDAEEVSLPWRRGSGSRNYFWKFYLESSPDGVSAQEARRRFVPLRRSLAPPAVLRPVPEPRLEAVKLRPTELRLEAFYYPHAVATTTTVRLSGEASLEEAVDALNTVRSARFRLSGSGGGAAADVPGRKLEEIADLRLAELVEELTGAPLPPGRLAHPFSVVTVLQGQGVPVNAKAGDDPMLQRALNGLVTGLKDWKLIPAPPLEECQIELRPSPASHLLYGRDRARAVWFPAPMVDRDRRSTLGCYHRNLTMASLQTASLLALAGMAAAHLASPAGLPAALVDPARRAADILGRLYGGKGTYRSASVAKQIDDSPHRGAVDELRRHVRGPGSELRRAGAGAA